ncbi:MAG: hypothetical protein ACKOCX_02920 [Planctomycetota bacterium]
MPPGGRSRLRNFLSAAEHRKLFWRFMPPAVVALVTLDLLTRSSGPPPAPREPQVDTRIEKVAGPPPEQDAVVILAPDEPPAVAEAELSASVTSLAKVRDATFFRQADEDAWLESLLTLRGYEGRSLVPPRDVGFTELFGQPASFRGRSVRMAGTLHRLERLRAPENNYGIDDYWQGWLEPAGGPASPVIVHFLEVPAGMPTGLSIHEPVVVSGCFLKNMAYKASDTVRVAPLLLARAPARRAVAVDDSGGGLWDLSLTAIGVVTMLAIVTSIAVGFFLVGRSRRKRAATAAGLDAALADVEPFSVAASLARVAADEVAEGDEPSAGDRT